ncbi:MAG: hypothetical protein H0W86_08250 [Armatimonadetes bacterium]|nr:hypothetical protein [Armatimonadota bacterium]
MIDFYDAWNASVDSIKKQVTGVGVWTALNVAIPITFEDGTFVVGISENDPEARGHLQLLNVVRIMEQELSKRIGRATKVEVIDGITINHWEAIKRKRTTTERLSAEAAEREKKSKKVASSWDKIYDQMAREFGKLTHKGLPQVRAKFMHRCVDLCSDLINPGMSDEDNRNYARCLERISSYTEVPTAYIASLVLIKTGQV